MLDFDTASIFGAQTHAGAAACTWRYVCINVLLLIGSITCWFLTVWLQHYLHNFSGLGVRVVWKLYTFQSYISKAIWRQGTGSVVLLRWLSMFQHYALSSCALTCALLSFDRLDNVLVSIWPPFCDCRQATKRGWKMGDGSMCVKWGASFLKWVELRKVEEAQLGCSQRRVYVSLVGAWTCHRSHPPFYPSPISCCSACIHRLKYYFTTLSLLLLITTYLLEFEMCCLPFSCVYVDWSPACARLWEALQVLGRARRSAEQGYGQSKRGQSRRHYCCSQDI